MEPTGAFWEPLEDTKWTYRDTRREMERSKRGRAGRVEGSADGGGVTNV